MFISYEYIKYLGYDKETDEYRYQYKIVDNDFEETVAGAVADGGAGASAVPVAVPVAGAGVGAGVGGVGVGVGVGVAVVDVYERRNLPVAANLMKAILFTHKEYPFYSVEQIISWNKQYNKKFVKYERELDKYMVLL